MIKGNYKHIYIQHQHKISMKVIMIEYREIVMNKHMGSIKQIITKLTKNCREIVTNIQLASNK